MYGTFVTGTLERRTRLGHSEVNAKNDNVSEEVDERVDVGWNARPQSKERWR